MWNPKQNIPKGPPPSFRLCLSSLHKNVVFNIFESLWVVVRVKYHLESDAISFLLFLNACALLSGAYRYNLEGMGGEITEITVRFLESLCIAFLRGGGGITLTYDMPCQWGPFFRVWAYEVHNFYLYWNTNIYLT